MTAPVWGVPWHGLVRNSRLALPDGTLKLWSQPEATRYVQGSTTHRPQDTYGSTFRHAAGMPEVVRSAEEQLLDEAAGHLWRNEAILSGGTQHLFRRALSGWIYVDPDGARWWVRCTALQNEPAVSLTAPLAVTVQLTRFGVIGGDAESYSYPASLVFSDRGGSSAGRLLLDAISPTGNAAVVMVYSGIVGTRSLLRTPICFLELTISGPGSAAVVACATARGNSELRQASPSVVPFQRWWLNSQREWSTSDPGGAVAFLECEWSGAREYTTIIAQWYDNAGVRQDVRWRLTGTLAVNAPRPDVPAPPEDLPVYATSSSLTAELQILMGSDVLSSLPISVDLSMTFTSVNTYTNGVVSSTHSSSVGGVTKAGASNWNRPTRYVAPWADLELLLGWPVLEGKPPWPPMAIRQLAGEALMPPVGEGTATTYRFSMVIYWYSRQLPGFEFSAESGSGDQPGTRVWHNLPPASPSGPVAGSTQVLASPNAPTYYGSHDPYTGAVSWYQFNPVCYV